MPARGRAGTRFSRAAAATSSRITGELTSLDLARFEIDARIDPRIGEVGEKIHEEPEKGEDVQIGEDDGVIAVDDRLERQEAQPVEREDRLDQKRAGEKGADEGAGKAGDNYQHGVPEDVAVEDLSPAQTFHPRGQHVLLLDLFKEGILGKKRRGGKGAKRHRDHRQGNVPEIVSHLIDQRELVEIFRCKATQRKYLPERATRKKHDQENRE